jgi:pimeloyl-ACP methyl ester carboxylesterase
VSWLAARGYKVYVLNLPGHGGSAITKPLGQYSIKDFVEAVWDFLIASREKQVHFIGHSMGGIILQNILEKQTRELKEPIVVKAVLLMSAPPAGIRLRGRVLKTLLKLRYSLPILFGGTFVPSREDAFELVLNDLTGQRTKIHAQFVPEAGRAARDLISLWKNRVSGKAIKNSRVRILVVSGKYDALLPPAIQFQIYLKYEGEPTSLLVLPTGHMPMMGEWAHDSIRQIANWLDL